MAKRRKRKSAKKKFSFNFFGGGRPKKKRRKGSNWGDWKILAKIFALVLVLGAMGTGIIFLSDYVERSTGVSQQKGVLELIDVPEWVNEALKEKILFAARYDGEDMKLDADAAESIQQNISTVAWVDDVRVRTANDRFVINANWRKPLGRVKFARRNYYVDADLVVLDSVEIGKLPIVDITGLAVKKTKPVLGEVLRLDDLAAATAILERLGRMDGLITPDKPLLFEIKSIDVRNFNGRRSSSKGHIILYAKDDTEIIWGAAIGTWQRHLESTDEEKLAKLYEFYKKFGTLIGKVKYINLRDPQDEIPQPIDKY